MFCDVFSTRGLPWYRKYHGFLHVFTSGSQSKPTKNSGIYTVWTRQHAKKRCFETIFHIFSARACQSKNQSFFAAFLPPFIRTQEGIKSPKKTKLRLNLTFCLSRSLLQSSSPWARKCRKLRCLMNVPCILLAKKKAPPAKADCVSASGKTRSFAPTVRADFIYLI